MLQIFKIIIHERRDVYRIWNKNILTGPANCKETTRHHAHLSLCAKSRKTNDGSPENDQKNLIWAIF